MINKAMQKWKVLISTTLNQLKERFNNKNERLIRPLFLKLMPLVI